MPEPRHNEAFLFCEYRQLDGNRETLFDENAKHVLLKVKYVLDPDPITSSKTYSAKVSTTIKLVDHPHFLKTFQKNTTPTWYPYKGNPRHSISTPMYAYHLYVHFR